MNFKEQLNRKREAAKVSQDKPLSEMSEQELDAEEQRVREKLRHIKEQELTASREAAESGTRPSSLFKRRRPLWR